MEKGEGNEHPGTYYVVREREGPPVLVDFVRDIDRATDSVQKDGCGERNSLLGGDHGHGVSLKSQSAKGCGDKEKRGTYKNAESFFEDGVGARSRNADFGIGALDAQLGETRTAFGVAERVEERVPVETKVIASPDDAILEGAGGFKRRWRDRCGLLAIGVVVLLVVRVVVFVRILLL